MCNDYLNPIEFNRVNETFFDTNRLVPHRIEINYLNADTLRIPVVINPQMDDRGIFIPTG